MTDLEALMWRLDRYGPMYRSHMTLALTLDRPADPGRAVQRVQDVVSRIPRLRERIVAGPLTMVPPTWEPDPSFALSNHLRRFAATTSGESADVLAAAETLAGEDLDPDRPPWQAVFVDGLPNGWQGLVLRLHHTYTDGLGALRLASELFDLERQPPLSTRGPEPADPERPAPGRAGDLTVEAQRTRALLDATFPWAARALRRALDVPADDEEAPAGVVRAALDDARLLARPSSRLWTDRSPGISLRSIDLPVPELRRSAHRAGGTINDVFIAGLLGGVARYHAKHGPIPPSVRVAIPISTKAGDSEMRNQLQGAAIRGPLRLTDPVERIRLVHEMVVRARNQPYLPLVEQASAVALRVPGVVHLAAKILRSVDVVASNVPGPPADLFLAGSRVERMVPVGPRSGAALNVTLVSYSDSAYLGVNSDPSAIPDQDVLIDCLGAGFDEVIG
jgi:diacylglycerol O-acyltransferase